MKLIKPYLNIFHLDSIVELGPTSCVDYCIYKISGMFSINFLQPVLELEANNLDFCFEDFWRRAISDSRNLFSFKPDLNFS